MSTNLPKNVKSSDGRGLVELVKEKLKLSGEDYEIGFFPEAKYADGTQVAQVAYWNENGSCHPGGQFLKTPEGKRAPELIRVPAHKVPPRPFMEPAAEKYIGGAMDLAVLAIADGKGEERAMREAARFLKDRIKDEISAFDSPPNAPLTVYLKGSSHPLIDTGKMMRSVNFKKVEK